jgi:UrcA family protein
MKTMILALAALALVPAMSVSAAAKDAARMSLDGQYFRVTTAQNADLRLKALERRAANACSKHAARTISERKFADQCVDDLVDHALDAIGSRELRLAHAARSERNRRMAENQATTARR